MDEPDFVKIASFLSEALRKATSDHTTEALVEARHFLQHDEYEMAFELLFLEIIRLKLKIRINIKEAKRIGEELGLDRETVYEKDFWKWFLEHLRFLKGN